MGKTLESLLADFGLSEAAPTGQEKTAGAAAQSEVDQVLESLGLTPNATAGAESTTKVASENKKESGHMGLDKIYAEMFGDEGTEQEQVTQEKVASEAAPSEKTASEETSPSELFGEMVAHYFNAGHVELMDKVAGPVDADQQPLAHAATGGQLTGVIGSPKDPQMEVNHDASGGKDLKVMTGNSSPYSLAVKQKILKRMAGEGIVGEQK